MNSRQASHDGFDSQYISLCFCWGAKKKEQKTNGLFDGAKIKRQVLYIPSERVFYPQERERESGGAEFLAE